MKYVAIFHANLNYAYLTPDKYEFVIRNSYELLFDTMATQFPGTKYVFEASGYTVEQIALRTPDVLAKLRAAMERGECEFMALALRASHAAELPREGRALDAGILAPDLREVSSGCGRSVFGIRSAGGAIMLPAR